MNETPDIAVFTAIFLLLMAVILPPLHSGFHAYQIGSESFSTQTSSPELLIIKGSGSDECPVCLYLARLSKHLEQASVQTVLIGVTILFYLLLPGRKSLFSKHRLNQRTRGPPVIETT